MDDSTKAEIIITHRLATQKVAALPAARKAEFDKAVAEARMPYPVESYVELRVATVVAICDAIKTPTPESAACRKSVAGHDAGVKVCIGAEVAKKLIEAAGLNEKVSG